jgi:site-specific recombinase XerD
MRSKRDTGKVTRATPVEQLPQYLTRHEVQEFLALGKSSTYQILRQHGTKVAGMHRLPKAALLELLAS